MARRVLDSASAFVKARKQNVMKVRHAWRKVVHYVRTDLKEIAFPSSMPNPPGYVPPRRARLKDVNWEVLKEAWKLYLQTWSKDYSEPGYNDEKTKDKGARKDASGKEKEEEPSVVEELAVAARLGGEHIKPALQRIYMTRAAAYRDALKAFVEGYKQGISEAIQHSKTTMQEKVREAAERAVAEEARAAREETMKSQQEQQSQQQQQQPAEAAGPDDKPKSQQVI